MPAAAVDPRLLNGLGPDLVSRAHYSGAYGKVTSEDRYRRIPD